MSTSSTPTRRLGGGRRSLILGACGVLFVLVAGYIGLAMFTGDRVPRGTTVVGVEVGGMSPEQAEDVLRKELRPLATKPIRATAGETEFVVKPEQAGLSIDIAATVERTHGAFSWNPSRVVQVIFGGERVEPVVRTDEKALRAAVDEFASTFEQKPREGAIIFVDGQVEVTSAKIGRALDRDGAVERIEAAYPAVSADTITLPTEESEPRVGEDDIKRAMTEIVEPALAGPITVAVDDNSFEIQPDSIAEVLTLTPVNGGELVPKLPPKKLSEVLADDLAEVATPPTDATIRIEDGAPTIVEAEAGRTVSPKTLSKAVVGVLGASGSNRTVRLKSVEQPAEVQGKDLAKLGIQEVVGEFTTYYPHADYRNTNIGRAAELIDGTLLEPGETFSLNGSVGERTEENGFTTGYVIEGGRLVNALGGGVSQLATTTYNAAFYAGLEDVEHRPHAFYIDRYPMGREATVYWGSIDLQFKNNTPHGVLVDAKVDPSDYSSSGVVTVRLWSTKYWEVEESTSEQYNFRSPETIYDPSEDCVEQTGVDGFDVDITRQLYRDGELVDTETDHWAYQPEDDVICEPEPEPEPKPDDPEPTDPPEDEDS